MPSLGCEKLQPERLLPPGSIPVVDERSSTQGLDVVCLQDEAHVGFMSMVESILRQAETHLQRLNARRRETVPASELVVGVQCGGSDAFSGVTANPAVGFCTDLLVRAGASVMFSETTEVRDGIAQLTARAATPELAEAMVREMAWYDAYLQRGSVDRSANTTPGNKKGGLSNIVEKAMGSIVKSGSAPIVGVLSPGEKLQTRGLTYAATPASDFICGTLQLAAGMNLHVFATGRGTPYGLAECPVIKVATRTDLARRWHDLMDVNAGTIAEGKATIEEVGWQLFHLMLDVASGRKKTWAEHWKLHNALVLFNPAPVTRAGGSLFHAAALKGGAWQSQRHLFLTIRLDIDQLSLLGVLVQSTLHCFCAPPCPSNSISTRIMPASCSPTSSRRMGRQCRPTSS